MASEIEVKPRARCGVMTGAINPLDHLKLVRWVANRYRNRGLDFEDLLAEGTLALIRAANEYDPDRSTKFSYYANKFIENHLFNKTRKSGDWTMRRRELRDAPATPKKSSEEKVQPDLTPLLGQLPEIEATILRLRFGLDREPMTTREAGAASGRSGSNVSRIERRAIKRLQALAGVA